MDPVRLYRVVLGEPIDIGPYPTVSAARTFCRHYGHGLYHLISSRTGRLVQIVESVGRRSLITVWPAPVEEPAVAELLGGP